MLVKDFIERTLVEGVEEMTIGINGLASHPYHGFILITQFIEFLGACYDKEDWGKKGLSESRFRRGIKELFPKEYMKYNDNKCKYDLFNNLRCPLVHQIRPGNPILLSERKHEISSGLINRHLKIQNNQLLMIYEDFWEDYKLACYKVIDKIKKKRLISQRVYNPIIIIPRDNN